MSFRFFFACSSVCGLGGEGQNFLMGTLFSISNVSNYPDALTFEENSFKNCDNVNIHFKES